MRTLMPFAARTPAAVLAKTSQTNLIVQGVGGYKFTDFVKVGLPLNLITFLISVFVIPMIWKF